jgi:hypothetical protein
MDLLNISIIVGASFATLASLVTIASSLVLAYVVMKGFE